MSESGEQLRLSNIVESVTGMLHVNDVKLMSCFTESPGTFRGKAELGVQGVKPTEGLGYLSNCVNVF